LVEKETAKESDSKPTLPKKMDMYTLRKTLKEQKPKHVSLYEALREETLQWMLSFIR